jgi:hypothetical protein
MRYHGPMSNTTTTTESADATLIAHLITAGFTPGRWDSPSTRIFDRKNMFGHTTLRVAIGEETSLHAFCGTRAQIQQWQATFTGAPVETIKAAIYASL